MRFSTILLMLAACVLAGSEEPVDIEKSNEMKIDWRYIKNGVIQVKIIKHIMILNLTKNGETHHFYTRFFDKLILSLPHPQGQAS